MNDSIIVYRNPLEKMFWEGNYMFPLLVFMLSTVIIAVILMKAVDRIFKPRREYAEPINYFLLALSCVFGFCILALL